MNDEMKKRIHEQLKQLEDSRDYLIRNPQAEKTTTWVPGGTYSMHVEHLLEELEKTKRQSEQWELMYYREKNKGRKMQ